MKPISVSKNDGIVVIEDCNVKSDEIKKVRLINLIEPFIVYGLILLIMWVSQLDKSLIWMWVSFAILLFWALFMSPVVHYYLLNEKEIFLRPEQRNFWFWFFESRGLGSIKKYFQRNEAGKPGFVQYWNSIKKVLILWNALIFCVPYAFETEYNEVIVQLFGIANPITRIIGIVILIVVASILMVFILFPVMIRLDNFEEGWKNQLKTLTMIGIPFVIIFNLFFQIFYEDLLIALGTEGAFALVGNDPLTRLDAFNLMDYGGQFVGYIASGWIQQLLFLSIFSSNFCRAFDLEKKPQTVYIAAFLSAFFFGLIHLPNFWLSILTWTAGYLWAITFMKNRNLMILGISHGMLASLGNHLLPISYTVGPGSI